MENDKIQGRIEQIKDRLHNGKYTESYFGVGDSLHHAMIADIQFLALIALKNQEHFYEGAILRFFNDLKREALSQHEIVDMYKDSFGITETRSGWDYDLDIEK